MPRIDYGLDAPVVIRNLALIGLLGIGAGATTWIAAPSWGWALCWLPLTGTVCLLEAALMVASSRWGKLRVRDAALRRLALTGTEAMLDVGCGHGLMLIGAAKLLPYGRAVGIDCWSTNDQADNSRAATLANAANEGVAERVELHDGDMRDLPFADASFDVVTACLSIHNIPDAAGRARAVREIVRVLKPGGRLDVLDFSKTAAYVQTLRDLGWREVHRSRPTLWMFPLIRAVTGIKPT